MSFLTPIDCPRCGAPLPPDAIGASLATCPYCDGTLVADARVVWASRYERALAEPSGPDLVSVGSRPYLLEGLVARGECSDVYLARRAITPTERVVLKAPRTADGEALLENEWRALEALHDSGAPGAVHFTMRLPQLVHRGPFEHGTASVMRFQSGFVHTLNEVRSAHGALLDPRHTSWIWRRSLELLGFVHASGWQHGALHPEHLLVHARDHGVMFVGWSRATRLSDPSRDLAALAACMSALGPLPAPLARLVHTPAHDAWALVEEVKHAARAAFGPPAYVELRL